MNANKVHHFAANNVANLAIEIAHYELQRQLHNLATGRHLAYMRYEPHEIECHTCDLKPRLDCVHPTIPHHFAFPSRIHAGEVCYMTKYSSGKHERMKVGRYLKRFFPTMGDNEIKTFAEKAAASADCGLEFTQEIVEHYIQCEGTGLRSCMAHKVTFFDSTLHPMEFFEGNSDFALAIWVKDGAMTQRCLVNHETKEYSRVYGSGPLAEALHAKGYSKGNFDGVELPRLVDDNGQTVMPYIDDALSGGAMSYNVNGDTIKLAYYGEYCADSTNGLATFEGGAICDCCGDRMHADESYYDEHGHCEVCEDCVNRYYVRAMGRGGDYELMREDDAIKAEDGEYFTCAEAASMNDYVCVENGDWYSLDDVFFCEYCEEYHHHDDHAGHDENERSICEYCAKHDHTEVLNDSGDTIYMSDTSDCIEIDGIYYQDDSAAEYAGFVLMNNGEWLTEEESKMQIELDLAS